jgi:hypothetical protein
MIDAYVDDDGNDCGSDNYDGILVSLVMLMIMIIV